MMTMANMGYFLLSLAAVLSAYSSLASLWGGRRRDERLVSSATRAAHLSTAGVGVASIFLMVLLLDRDYSLAYIYKNTSNDLPLRYTIAAFWASLEGSHLLWTLLLGLFCSLALLTAPLSLERLRPYVCMALQMVLTWMLYLALTHSNPFAPMRPIPANGQGLNALLQNPYMVIHPPLLFLGYTASGIPFAYAIAALCYGDVVSGWLLTVRRWALVAWIALSAGIFLGGRWAYVELGWAGYWAWDPVENSSLMPWLFLTALLHSLSVQARVGHLKRLGIVLSCLAFFFSFFGTFLTRSGVVSSVHSFASSPIGPNYLSFLFVLMVSAGALYLWRSPGIIANQMDKVWGLSRESALVVAQFLLAVFALVVFLGTLYPVISEAVTGVRFNVQAPYFNSFAPYIGALIMLVIGWGNLLRYRRAGLRGGWRGQLAAWSFAILAAGLFAYLGGVFASSGFRLLAQLVGTVLVFWTAACLVIELVGFMRETRGSLSRRIGRNLAQLGAFVAHLGVLVAILGFLGNYRGLETTKTLNKGESFELYDYRLTFEALRWEQVENALLVEAPLRISGRRARGEGELVAARAKYPTKEELFHEVGLVSTFWHDIYGILVDYDQAKGEHVTVTVHINPTVRLVWLSVFLLVLGGILCVLDRYRGRRSLDHALA